MSQLREHNRLQETHEQLFSPQTLEAIKSLEFAAITAAEGAFLGHHRTRRKGTSTEFREHKIYTPGDDLRRMDWRASAKTDRFQIKQFEDETNLHVILCVDHSASMGFPKIGQTKLDYARVLAAAFAYLALSQHDTVGLLDFSDRITTYLPPQHSGHHFYNLLQQLLSLVPQKETSAQACVNFFLEAQINHALVIVLSDLFYKQKDAIESLSKIVSLGHDLIIVQILDETEVTFPFVEPAEFYALEDTRFQYIHPKSYQKAYTLAMKQYIEQCQAHVSKTGGTFTSLLTKTPVHESIREILHRYKATYKFARGIQS